MCVLLFMIAVCSLYGCDISKDANSSTAEPNYIELNIDNYDYLLTIDKVTTNSGKGAGVSWSRQQVTIYGALNGIYEDCVLTYRLGDSGTAQTVRLNISGYATFNYTWTSAMTGKFEFIDASGKIYI